MTFNTNYGDLYNLRTAKYDGSGENPCEVCGKEIKQGQGSLVVTDQGEYPIGSTCKAKARKAGFEIIQDWRS